jgi:hypothetical protein
MYGFTESMFFADGAELRTPKKGQPFRGGAGSIEHQERDAWGQHSGALPRLRLHACDVLFLVFSCFLL